MPSKGRREPATPKRPDGPPCLLTGLEDPYHGLLVGPVDPGTAESEAGCRIVEVVGVTDEGDFDCTHDEWVEHFWADVRRAAQEDLAHEVLPASQPDSDPLELVWIAQARTTGLEDGTRIEAHGDGWIVVDGLKTYRVDPEDAAWVAGVNDEGRTPMIFRSSEEAYRPVWRPKLGGASRSPVLGRSCEKRGRPALQFPGKRGWLLRGGAGHAPL